MQRGSILPLVLITTILLVCTTRPSRVSLGRDESDDIYEGEWNLQRGQQADFPGVNPDNPDGPSWMIGMHRDGENTPGSWAKKNNQVISFIRLYFWDFGDQNVPAINTCSRKSSKGNNWR